MPIYACVCGDVRVTGSLHPQSQRPISICQLTKRLFVQTFALLWLHHFQNDCQCCLLIKVQYGCINMLHCVAICHKATKYNFLYAVVIKILKSKILIFLDNS